MSTVPDRGRPLALVTVTEYDQALLILGA